jgi:hypothetical protein
MLIRGRACVRARFELLVDAALGERRQLLVSETTLLARLPLRDGDGRST